MIEKKVVDIDDSWHAVLSDYFKTDKWRDLTEFVKNEYKTETVFPKPGQVLRAFDLCPFNEVKVVILGQDPYHTPGAAEGLAFSIANGLPVQPSLRNIFKEVFNDTGSVSNVLPGSSLIPWAEQGVLLLNSVLTVRQGAAASHAKKGWEEFTDCVIQKISDEKEKVVFILWGSYAQKKGLIIDESKHLVLRSPHPSPLSAHRGFFGSKPFSQANKYLLKNSISVINW